MGRLRGVVGKSLQWLKERGKLIDFKACPRCRGDIRLVADIYGDYSTCLQCGYSRDVLKVRPVTFEAAALRARTGRPRKAARRQQAA